MTRLTLLCTSFHRQKSSQIAAWVGKDAPRERLIFSNKASGIYAARLYVPAVLLRIEYQGLRFDPAASSTLSREL